jgi:hypothetical protein
MSGTGLDLEKEHVNQAHRRLVCDRTLTNRRLSSKSRVKMTNGRINTMVTADSSYLVSAEVEMTRR